MSYWEEHKTWTVFSWLYNAQKGEGGQCPAWLSSEQIVTREITFQ
jgi:hypothetical protein